MLTWEDKQFLGGGLIVDHLVGLPFGKVQHKIVTTDAQPSQPGAEHLIVLVTGQLIVGPPCSLACAMHCVLGMRATTSFNP